MKVCSLRVTLDFVAAASSASFVEWDELWAGMEMRRLSGTDHFFFVKRRKFVSTFSQFDFPPRFLCEDIIELKELLIIR